MSLKGRTLHSESITTNFELLNPVKKFISVSYTNECMIGFDGFVVYIFKSKKLPYEQLPKAWPILNLCTRKGRSYPINAIKGVLMSDALFNCPERVYANTWFAVRSNACSIKLIKQITNTFMWFLKEQHYMLALKTITFLQ